MALSDMTKKELITELRRLRSRCEEYEDARKEIQRETADRQKAETALRESEETMKALLNATQESAILVDLKGRILAVNEIAARRLGKSTKELIGLDMYSYLPQDVAKARKAQGRKIVRSKKPIRFQDERQGRSFDNNLYPVLDKEGKVKAIAIYARDISEAVKAGEARRISEQKYRTLFEGAHDAIFIMDKDVFVDCNRMAVRLFGYTKKDDLVGHRPWEFSPEKQPDGVGSKTKAHTWIDSVLGGRPLRSYWKHVRKDGSPFDAEVALNRLDLGDKTYIQAITRDITERAQAMEALKESEEKFRNLAEQSPNMIFINHRGRIVYANKEIESNLGYTKEEISAPGFDFKTLIAADSLATIEKNFEKHMKGQEVEPYEYGLISKGGERIDALITTKLIDYQGERAILGIITDITELKRVEAALRDSESRYRALFDKANDGVALIDLQGSFILINHRGADMLGYSVEEFMELSNVDIVAPNEIEDGREKLKRLIDGETYAPYERTFIKKDGSPLPADVNISLQVDETGHPLFVWSIFRDISERKLAEKALQESEQKYRLLVENLPSVVWSSNEKAATTYISSNVEDVFGYTREEIYQSGDKIWFDNVHPDDIGKVRDSFEAIFSKNQSYDIEYRLKRKDGRWIWIHDVSSMCLQIDGMDYAFGVFTDITERKTVEKELYDYREKLRNLALELSSTEQRERRKIATYMHDHIGQKLALSKIKLGALQETMGGSGNVAAIADIRELIEESLQDTRQLTFELSPPILYELGLEQSLGWLVEQFRDKYKSDISFQDDEEPKPLDEAARVVVFQAVRELLVNALKHSDAESIRVKVSRDRGNLSVLVQDDGTGFDEASEKSYSPKIGGFGLFNIRERLKELDGGLEIESTAGKGTCITFVVPLSSDPLPSAGQ
jgi:PAS domain S-box-containing protein